MKQVSGSPLELVKKIARFASDKKAGDIVILDMRQVANFCDYFVLCTGNSSRQVKAIAQGVDEGLSTEGQAIKFKQGFREGSWVLLDLGDVVVHIFDNETREFYGLDYLWRGARRVPWSQEAMSA